MAEEIPKYISIAIQDPAEFINKILKRNPTVQSIDVNLVRRVENEYSTGYFGSIPSGKFAFFNKSIRNDLTDRNPLVRGLEVKLVGDGYSYLVGGQVESEFFLTPKDVERLPKGFPLVDVDSGNFQLGITYDSAPKEWKKSRYDYERSRYQEGWLQVKVNINTDSKGNLVTNEQIVEKKEKKGFFGGTKTVEVPKTISRLIALPDNDRDHFCIVLDDVIRVCQLLEQGVNSLHSYARGNYEPIGEVQLARVYPIYDNPSQIIFQSGGGDETLAKSYSLFERNGTHIYKHYIELEKGDIKVRQSKDEPAKAEDKGTKTISKPRPVQKISPKPMPEEEHKLKIENGGSDEKISLDNVVGATEAKKELLRVCDYFKNPEEYRKWGISQKAGVLLYGPPGTGKTLLARGLANEAEAHFMLYKSQEIMSKWSGESEANLGRLLDEAKKYERCVLLMDELDALARKRELSDGSSHGTEGRLVNMLLSFLDGFDRQDNVYLIGTTNRKEIIDDAILQRLYPIVVPLPDLAGRLELVRRSVEKHGATAQINPFGDIDYQTIAQASDGLSGRDLVGEKQGIFLTLLHKAKEMTDQNNGELYVVSTQDWLDEVQKLKPEPPRHMGFHT